MAHEVFICHSSEDGNVAHAIVNALESNRIRCWYAPRDVKPGVPYSRSIIYGIRECRILVLILSSRANQSRHVLNEVERAVNNEKHILSFRIEDVLPSDDLELFLSAPHWLDALTPPVEQHLGKLTGSVTALLPPRDADDPDGKETEKEPPRTGREVIGGTPPVPARGRARRWGQVVLGLLSVMLLFWALYVELLGPKFSRPLVGAEAERLVHGHCWITYEPQGFTPFAPYRLAPEEIDGELDAIRQAGFDGIITFGSRGDVALIPKLAKAKGFVVIAGVWDPNDSLEVAIAIANKPYVDAYCVGHSNLGPTYSYSELSAAVEKIRFRTRRPVTTTERIARYASDRRLLGLGDFVFPDVHVWIETEGPWAEAADADRDAEETIDLVRSFGDDFSTGDKPVLLKMVTYPVAGLAGASLKEQTRFFGNLLRDRRGVDPSVPSGIGVSVHGAFDKQWEPDEGSYEWDMHTGLLETDGVPRPAALEITKRLP